MRIVVLKGSPHKKGSSNLLAEQFIKGAKETGHFVTPIYYFGMSAQLKMVIDRFYSYTTRLSGKHMKDAYDLGKII